MDNTMVVILIVYTILIYAIGFYTGNEHGKLVQLKEITKDIAKMLKKQNGK